MVFCRDNNLRKGDDPDEVVHKIDEMRVFIMKVFISQPMKDKTCDEIKEARSNAINTVCRMHPKPYAIEFLDTFFEDYDGSAVQFLGKSIMKLGEADLAVFLPGWRDARGCRNEQRIAVDYEVECLYF